MKKFSVLLLAGVALTAAAQHKIDFPGRMVIENARLQAESDVNNGPNVMAPLSSRAQSESAIYGVMVEFNGMPIDVSEYVTEVGSQIGDILIVSVTPTQMEQLAELPEVKSITMGYEARPLMMKGRAATSVDEVHAGTGLDRGYTGKGVIAGLYDTGLDVNHINFLDANKEPRTKRMWVYSDNTGRPAVTLSDPTAIKNYTTETDAETHGTHVLGIMAGGYKGAANYSYLKANNRAEVISQSDATSSIPYYGVATDADLAVTCGPLYQSAILDGVSKIVEYAKSQKQPCVVNLSIGNNVGPHDGSDAFSKGLDELGKYAIIFISAGNEGRDNISVCADGSKLKTFVASNAANAYRASGTIDIWGSDNQVFTVRVFGYDRSTGKETFSYTLDRNLEGKKVAQGDMPGFSSGNLSGSISLSSNINPSNNRYNVSADVNTTGKKTSDLLGIEIIPVSSNQVVDGFSRNLVYTSQSQPGFTDGTPDNSINGLGCGSNVINVGSYCTSKVFAVLNGGTPSYVGGSDVGSRSEFSSYGWRANGEQLPHVCAPGEVIISSISEYYVRKKNLGDNDLSGRYEDENSNPLFARNSTWQGMQGTSMASPFAAGIVATWLEADPTLTVDRVKEIIQETSTRDLLINAESEKWGAGKINALAGIKKVIETRAGVDNVTTDGEKAIVSSVDGKNFEIFVGGAQGVEARLVSLAGTNVAQAKSNHNTVNLSAENVAAGVYVLTITSDRKTETRKIMVK